MKKTLTDRALQALKPADKGSRYMVWDGLLPSFGVRVTENRHVTFIVMRRLDGKLVRRTIGRYPAISLEKAREQARAAVEDLSRGIDPREKVEAERLERERKARDNFKGVAETFITKHVASLRTSKEVTAAIRGRLISAWGDRPITSITKGDVIRLLDGIVDQGYPYAAHKLLAYTSKLFNWAIARDAYGLVTSPCDRIKPGDVIGRKEARQRVLTDDEIRAFWQATGKTEYPFGPLFRFLLLTGQRRDEAAGATWSEIDLKKKLWTIPAARMKADAPHLVPLSAQAVALLEDLPRFTGDEKKGDFVFTTTAGARPVSGFSKAKMRLDAEILKILRDEAESRGETTDGIAVSDWRLHDLRRTARTHFSAIPAPDMVRELAISHTRPGLHKVYDQHLYLAEKRALFEAWGRRLTGIVRPNKGDKVVSINGRDTR